MPGEMKNMSDGFSCHRCPTCSKVFPKQPWLKHHMLSCTPSLQSASGHPGIGAVSLVAAEEVPFAQPTQRVSIGQQSNEAPYKCPLCAKGFNLHFCLKQHMVLTHQKQVHLQSLNSILSISARSPTWSPHQWKKSVHLKKRVWKSSPSPKRKGVQSSCPFCFTSNHKYKSLWHLQRHMSFKHPKVESSNSHLAEHSYSVPPSLVNSDQTSCEGMIPANGRSLESIKQDPVRTISVNGSYEESSERTGSLDDRLNGSPEEGWNDMSNTSPDMDCRRAISFDNDAENSHEHDSSGTISINDLCEDGDSSKESSPLKCPLCLDDSNVFKDAHELSVHSLSKHAPQVLLTKCNPKSFQDICSTSPELKEGQTERSTNASSLKIFLWKCLKCAIDGTDKIFKSYEDLTNHVVAKHNQYGDEGNSTQSEISGDNLNRSRAELIRSPVELILPEAPSDHQVTFQVHVSLDDKAPSEGCKSEQPYQGDVLRKSASSAEQVNIKESFMESYNNHVSTNATKFPSEQQDLVMYDQYDIGDEAAWSFESQGDDDDNVERTESRNDIVDDVANMESDFCYGLGSVESPPEIELYESPVKKQDFGSSVRESENIQLGVADESSERVSSEMSNSIRPELEQIAGDDNHEIDAADKTRERETKNGKVMCEGGESIEEMDIDPGDQLLIDLLGVDRGNSLADCNDQEGDDNYTQLIANNCDESTCKMVDDRVSDVNSDECIQAETKSAMDVAEMDGAESGEDEAHNKMTDDKSMTSLKQFALAPVNKGMGTFLLNLTQIVSSRDDDSVINTIDSSNKIGSELKNQHTGCSEKDISQESDSHYTFSHSSLKDQLNLIEKSPSSSGLKCKVCHKRFSKDILPLVHMRSHFEKQHYHCSLCQFKSSFKSAMLKHVQTNHKVDQPKGAKRHLEFKRPGISREPSPPKRSEVTPERKGKCMQNAEPLLELSPSASAKNWCHQEKVLLRSLSSSDNVEFSKLSPLVARKLKSNRRKASAPRRVEFNVEETAETTATEDNETMPMSDDETVNPQMEIDDCDEMDAHLIIDVCDSTTAQDTGANEIIPASVCFNFEKNSDTDSAPETEAMGSEVRFVSPPYRQRFEKYDCTFELGDLTLRYMKQLQELPADVVITCAVCHMTVKGKKTGFEHAISHTEELPYRCKHCKVRGKTLNKMLYHLVFQHHILNPKLPCWHGGLLDDETEVSQKKPDSSSDDLHDVASTGPDSTAAEKSTDPKADNPETLNHTESVYQRADVIRGFQTKECAFLPSLNLYHALVQLSQKSLPRKCQAVPCVAAGKKMMFHSLQTLFQHTLCHTDENPYICRLCPYKRKKLSFLNNHMKMSHYQVLSGQWCLPSVDYLFRSSKPVHHQSGNVNNSRPPLLTASAVQRQMTSLLSSSIAHQRTPSALTALNQMASTLTTSAEQVSANAVQQMTSALTTSTQQPPTSSSMTTSTEQRQKLFTMTTSTEQPHIPPAVTTSTEHLQEPLAMTTSTEQPHIPPAMTTSTEHLQEPLAMTTSTEQPHISPAMTTSTEHLQEPLAMTTSTEQTQRPSALETSAVQHQMSSTKTTSTEPPQIPASFATSTEQPQMPPSMTTQTELKKISYAMIASAMHHQIKSALTSSTEQPHLAPAMTTSIEPPQTPGVATSAELQHIPYATTSSAEQPQMTSEMTTSTEQLQIPSTLMTGSSMLASTDNLANKTAQKASENMHLLGAKNSEESSSNLSHENDLDSGSTVSIDSVEGRSNTQAHDSLPGEEPVRKRSRHLQKYIMEVDYIYSPSKEEKRIKTYIKKHRTEFVACPFCSMKLKANDLCLHLRKHERSKPYSCCHCGFKCDSYKEIPKHLETSHLEAPSVSKIFHICNYQNKRYHEVYFKASDSSLKGSQIYHCNACGYSNRIIDNMRQHVHKYHKTVVGLEKDPLDGLYHCLKCNDIWADFITAVNHKCDIQDVCTIKKHPSTGSQEDNLHVHCNLCDFKAQTEAAMLVHLAIVHDWDVERQNAKLVIGGSHQSGQHIRSPCNQFIPPVPARSDLPPPLQRNTLQLPNQHHILSGKRTDVHVQNSQPIGSTMTPITGNGDQHPNLWTAQSLQACQQLGNQFPRTQHPSSGHPAIPFIPRPIPPSANMLTRNLAYSNPAIPSPTQSFMPPNTFPGFGQQYYHHNGSWKQYPGSVRDYQLLQQFVESRPTEETPQSLLLFESLTSAQHQTRHESVTDTRYQQAASEMPRIISPRTSQEITSSRIGPVQGTPVPFNLRRYMTPPSFPLPRLGTRPSQHQETSPHITSAAFPPPSYTSHLNLRLSTEDPALPEKIPQYVETPMTRRHIPSTTLLNSTTQAVDIPPQTSQGDVPLPASSPNQLSDVQTVRSDSASPQTPSRTMGTDKAARASSIGDDNCKIPADFSNRKNGDTDDLEEDDFLDWMLNSPSADVPMVSLSQEQNFEPDCQVTNDREACDQSTVAESPVKTRDEPKEASPTAPRIVSKNNSMWKKAGFGSSRPC